MDFGAQFTSYEEEAFRLECYPEYRVSGEWDIFQDYLKTGAVPANDPDFESYLADVKMMIAKGCRHIRTRILPEPMTDYVRFETKFGYVRNAEAGSDVRMIPHDHPLAPEWKSFNDFWLFDRKRLFHMKYEEDGSYIGAELCTDPDVISMANKIRDDIMATARPLSSALKDILG